jgi:hypothetical protein
MNEPARDAIASFFDNNEKLSKAMGKAVQMALRTHKLLGQPIVVWRDGKPVWVPPEEIELADEKNGKHPAD